jgi:hypothetical protein
MFMQIFLSLISDDVKSIDHKHKMADGVFHDLVGGLISGKEIFVVIYLWNG